MVSAHASTDDVEGWHSPRWNATYGALVAMNIESCTKKNGRLPNADDFLDIVSMSRDQADKAEEAWKKLAEMSQWAKARTTSPYR